MKNLLSRYDWQELEFSALPTSGVQRTRNFLISQRIDYQWDDEVVRVELDGSKRAMERWLQPPWVPGSLPLKLPDFLKPMPRRHCPSPVGDWAHLDQETLDRWEADKWQWPPEHYQEDRLLWKGRQDGRHPSADERDVLLGFSRGHTAPAVSSSMLKSGGERVRLALVAHGIHAEHLAWLLSRAGKAKGWLSADCSWVSILARIEADVPYVPTFAPKGMRKSSDEKADADFVKRVVTAVDHRGSDVRLNVGQLLTPSCWPRQSFKPHFWRWRHLFSWSWKKQAHINVLEASAGLAALCWRLRSKRGVGKRFLHLLDSQVSQAVLSRRRSTSKVLNFIVKRSSVLELAASCHSFYGFVRSDWHPADGASRNTRS
jgi:hypothetical protein